MLDAALAGDSMALVSKLHAFGNAVALLEPKLKDERGKRNLKSLKDTIVAIAQDVNSKVVKFSERLMEETVPNDYRETEFVSYQRMAENGREILAEELINIVLKSNESAAHLLPRVTPTTNSGNLARIGTSERLKQVVDVIEKQRTDSPVVQRRSLAHGNALQPLRDSIRTAAAKHPSSPLAAATTPESGRRSPATNRPDPVKLLKMAGDSSSMVERKTFQDPRRQAPKRRTSLDQHKRKSRKDSNGGRRDSRKEIDSKKEARKETDSKRDSRKEGDGKSEKTEKKRKLELKAKKVKH